MNNMLISGNRRIWFSFMYIKYKNFMHFHLNKMLFGAAFFSYEKNKKTKFCVLFYLFQFLRLGILVSFRSIFLSVSNDLFFSILFLIVLDIYASLSSLFTRRSYMLKKIKRIWKIMAHILIFKTLKYTHTRMFISFVNEITKRIISILNP